MTTILSRNLPALKLKLRSAGIEMTENELEALSALLANENAFTVRRLRENSTTSTFSRKG